MWRYVMADCGRRPGAWSFLCRRADSVAVARTCMRAALQQRPGVWAAFGLCGRHGVGCTAAWGQRVELRKDIVPRLPRSVQQCGGYVRKSLQKLHSKVGIEKHRRTRKCTTPHLKTKKCEQSKVETLEARLSWTIRLKSKNAISETRKVSRFSSRSFLIFLVSSVVVSCPVTSKQKTISIPENQKLQNTC